VELTEEPGPGEPFMRGIREPQDYLGGSQISGKSPGAGGFAGRKPGPDNVCPRLHLERSPVPDGLRRDFLSLVDDLNADGDIVLFKFG
jgi:hypothetical protein